MEKEIKPFAGIAVNGILTTWIIFFTQLVIRETNLWRKGMFNSQNNDYINTPSGCFYCRSDYVLGQTKINLPQFLQQ